MKDPIVRSLLLVRLGQELGCDSQLARALASVVDAVIGMFK